MDTIVMKTTIQMAVALIFIATPHYTFYTPHFAFHCLRHCQKRGEDWSVISCLRTTGESPFSFIPYFKAAPNILSKYLNNCEISSLLVMTIDDAKLLCHRFRLSHNIFGGAGDRCSSVTIVPSPVLASRQSHIQAATGLLIRRGVTCHHHQPGIAQHTVQHCCLCICAILCIRQSGTSFQFTLESNYKLM